MSTLLHLDASARPGRSGLHGHGSHSRRLSAQFVARWRELRPADSVAYRDLGQRPPAPVDAAWVHAAFTPPAARSPWMQQRLAESDMLVDELLQADVIVAGVPMYNFGPPATFKAYVDNIVRVGRTFGFDRSRAGEPYWPLLAEQGKTLVLVTSRGDYGYAAGERLATQDHLGPWVRTAFGYIGIGDVHEVAAEYDEFGGERLQQSLERASADVDALAERLARRQPRRAA